MNNYLSIKVTEKVQKLHKYAMCKQIDLLAASIAGLVADGKFIFFFGSGSVGCFLQAFFSRLRINGEKLGIAGFLDNNPGVQGTEVQGSTVYSPEILHVEQSVSVLIATEYVNSMATQLDDFGLKPLVDYWDGYRLYKELRQVVRSYAGEETEYFPEELLEDIQHILNTRYFTQALRENPILFARTDYQEWKRYHRLTIRECRKLQDKCLRLPAKEQVPFIIVVQAEDENWLSVRKFLTALAEQVYPVWQVVVVIHAGFDLSEAEVLPEEIKSRVQFTTEEHILECSQALFGEKYVMYLAVYDRLAPEALYEYGRAICQNNCPPLLYCDEDFLDNFGIRSTPFFKPEWSPHAFLSHNYIGNRGICISGDWLLRQKVLMGSKSWLKELTTVCHLPQVLVHKGNMQDIDFVTEKVLFNQIETREAELFSAAKEGNTHTIFHVRYPLQGQPKISILIPTRDKAAYLSSCLESIFARTGYPNYEVIIIDNGSTEEETFSLFREWRQKEQERFVVIRVEEPFNYSRLNNLGVQIASGELVVLLNNDTEVITSDWLQDMAGYAQRSEVGAVGAMLLYADGTVQHAGVITGVGAVADHAFRGFPADDPGYFGRLQMVADYSAVTGACLMVRKELYQAVGGMEEALAVSYNDVDFCLKLREQGLYNVVLPFVRLYHYESKSRGANNTPEKIAQAKREEQFMHDMWGKVLKNDPFYSPHLTRESTDFAIRMPDVWDVDE